jgi:S1-C subfamily serine protease
VGTSGGFGWEHSAARPAASAAAPASGSGVAISGVVSGSAAAQAGLAAGDQITSVAGHTVTSSSDIQSVLGNYHPGRQDQHQLDRTSPASPTPPP